MPGAADLADLEGEHPPWLVDALSVERESGEVLVEGSPIHYLAWGRRDLP